MPPINEKEISKGVIYSEIYTEMRRYRDYELSAATWYTAILIVMLGFIVTDKSDVTFVRVAIGVLSTILGGSSIYSIWYVNRRYGQLLEIMNNHLEPQWKKAVFKNIRTEMILRPRHLIFIVQVSLILATWYFVCLSTK